MIPKFLTSLAVTLAFGISTAQAEVQTIEPAKAHEKIAAGALLVDVRSPEEFASGHLPGALNIPHEQVEQRLAEFGADKEKEIVLYCRSGRRSGLAAETLGKHGFDRLYNAGGYEGLAAVDPKR